MQKNPEMIFKKANQGNIIVVLDRKMYKQKNITNALRSRTHINIKKDPTNT